MRYNRGILTSRQCNPMFLRDRTGFLGAADRLPIAILKVDELNSRL